MNFRERIPWWAKLGAKIVLSRLPLDYCSWSRIGIFFRESKFAIASVNQKKWGKLPLSRAKLAPEFSSLPEDDLLTLGFDVVLRPSG